MNLNDIRNNERLLNEGGYDDLLNRAKESSWGSGGRSSGSNYNDLINKAKQSAAKEFANNWGSWSNWDSFDTNSKNLDSSARNACDSLSGEGKRACERAFQNGLDIWSNWDSFDSNSKNLDSSTRNACDNLSGEGKRACERASQNGMDIWSKRTVLIRTPKIWIPLLEMHVTVFLVREKACERAIQNGLDIWSNWDNFDSNTKTLDTSERNVCDSLSGEGERACEIAIQNVLDNWINWDSFDSNSKNSIAPQEMHVTFFLVRLKEHVKEQFKIIWTAGTIGTVSIQI